MRSTMRYVYLVLLGICIALIHIPEVAADEGIRLSSTTMRPGEFLTIKVKAPEDAVVKVIFLQASKKLQYIGSGWHGGFIACSYYTTTGSYPLAVQIVTKDDQTTTAVYDIGIGKHDFPESRIWVPESTRKQILTQENQDFDSKTAQAVREKAFKEDLPPLWTGKFTWPVKGKITTKFGLIRFVNDIENGRHSGLDIAAPTGTPVVSVNDGKVIFAGKLYLTGLTVFVHHGMDLYTTYAHLSKIEVKEGQRVSRGETVGLIGATGLATGPHLHLTVRIGEIPVDPYLFLDREIEFQF